MAYKLSVYIVLFLLFFNGAAVLLNASGTADYLGVEPDTGDTNKLDAAREESKSFGVSRGIGDTLFGLWITLSTVIETIVGAVFPGANMLMNAGVPSYIVSYGMAGLAVVPGIDLVKFLRGT